MTKRITGLLVTALIFAIPGAVWAAASPNYVTVDAGISRLNEFCNNTATGYECRNTAAAFSLGGGYQISDTLGVELAYAYYGASKKDGLLFGSNLEVTQELTGLKFFGTASFPLSNAYSLFGKLGASNTTTSVISKLASGANIPAYSASSTSVAYGVGLKYNLNESIAVRVQYENLGKTGDEAIGNSTLTLITLGLSYSPQKLKPRVSAIKPNVQSSPAPVQPPLREIVQLKSAPAMLQK